MALTPQDQRFYEEKLGWQAFVFLFLVTGAAGMVLWPLALYSLDVQNGDTSHWTGHLVFQVGMVGLMFGTVISLMMYVFLRCLLHFGWLPSQH